MSKQYCYGCQKKHEGLNWLTRFEDIEKANGIISEEMVTVCRKYFKPRSYEMVPDYIKQDRLKNLASQIQSHRGGELSKEWIGLHPEKTKDMVKHGALTEKEVNKAKNVWSDLPGIRHLNKTQ